MRDQEINKDAIKKFVTEFCKRKNDGFFKERKDKRRNHE